ncbi:MAG: hypothetical protein MN733_19260 [Nitrososphaera sp.]|nr:hypothetical protein [Nitrososphaera sp.]
MTSYRFTAKVKVSEEDDDTRYIVKCIELPGTIVDGPTIQDALDELAKAIIVSIDADPEAFARIKDLVREPQSVRNPSLHSVVIQEEDLGKTVFTEISSESLN